MDGEYTCPECGLPLCGLVCGGGPWHTPECEVFSRSVLTSSLSLSCVFIKSYLRLEKKIKVRTFGRGTVAYEYGCIAVIRLLWLR